MKFEHLIQINDPLNPLIESMTREQLWRGLVLRARQPGLFLPHMDECTIEERGDALQRRCRYGELVVLDKVLFTPMEQVRYDVPQQGEISASSLVMTIEAPAAGALFVRFVYDDGHDAAADETNKMYNDFKRSAYEQADIDTIHLLRELAAGGRLDANYLN